MKAELELNLAGKTVLIAVAVLALVAVIYSVSDTDTRPTDRIISSVESSGYPVCQGFKEGQRVSKPQFETILYGRWTGNCREGGGTVEVGFTVSREYLKNIVRQFGITDPNGKPLLVYREGCEGIKGFDGVIVGREDGPIREGETIEISHEERMIKICP